jgi:crotonobetainyl-CoA:carnitine CoA-transferase CaiB-like acyl-CoA transferase
VAAPQPGFGPLAGVRIVDLTVAFAGANATMLLADMGAEVIRIESRQHYSIVTRGPRQPLRGDSPEARAVARDYVDGDPGDEPWHRISWWNSHGRNKHAITLDLARERGRKLFLRLIERSDGLIENNSAGLLEKLGIAPDVLLQRNPRLIVVRMAPMGLQGPDVAATGFGWHFEELAGYLRVQGYPDGPDLGSIYMDSTSGPAGANAFLMAFLQRRRTGRGAVCEVAQVENLVAHIGELCLDAAMNGRVPPRWGNRSPDFAPQGCYRCAGDDAWVVLSVRSDEEWQRFVSVLGGPAALRRPELSGVSGRRAAHDEIDAAIAAWCGDRSPEDAAAVLQRAGIPAGPVIDEGRAFDDPHLQERGFFWPLDHPVAGTHLHAGPNVQMRGTPLQVWRAAPTVGQDNEYVYREILGVSDEEYDDLVADGHIGTDFA